jgi:hypothetical protein
MSSNFDYSWLINCIMGMFVGVVITAFTLLCLAKSSDEISDSEAKHDDW